MPKAKKKSKKSKMLKDLKDIEKYLREAGFIDKAEKISKVMHLLDGSLSQDASDMIPDDQANRGNQGYIGGDGTGGSYSGLHAPMVGQPADDQDNIDMVAPVNGLRGNSVLDNAGFSGFSDSYMYVGYGNLE